MSAKCEPFPAKCVAVKVSLQNLYSHQRYVGRFSHKKKGNKNCHPTSKQRKKRYRYCQKYLYLPLFLWYLICFEVASIAK